MIDQFNLDCIEYLSFNKNGLIPAIAQDFHSGKVLMMAWMNYESLVESMYSGYVVYWSRSRQKLWIKGEISGHTQKIYTMYLDCDVDVILIKVQQKIGITCHTGRNTCFYRIIPKILWKKF